MNILFFLAKISFFIWVIRNTLFWVSLWQLKEYRFDRMYIHLRETRQGRNLLFSPLSLIKWITIFLYLAVVFDYTPLISYQVIIAVIFSFDALVSLQEISIHLLKRPVFTIKSIALVLLPLIVIFYLVSIPLFEKFFWFLLLDRLSVLLIALFVFLFSLPTEIYRDLQIDRAVKKMRARKGLLVIGITGSYGKSSTKEYVAQVLEKKFKVLKTQGTNNTPIGLSNTILSGLRKTTEIFVAEMGAYKKGEIEQMCQIIRPNIGILTAVNDQHLSLFGSIENTRAAKYELIEALPAKNGLAIFNGNNENAYKLYKQTKKKKVLYKCMSEKDKEIVDIAARKIQVGKTSVKFTAHIGKKIVHMEAPLLGAHVIEDILPAIYLANHLGMTKEEIKKAVASLSPLPKTMVRQQLPTGVTVIDDSFNANPNAVVAALNYLKIYEKKRFLVFQPMIELGGNAKVEHVRVGREIGRVCNFLLLTNRNFYKEITKGIMEAGSKCVVKVGTAVELTEFLSRRTRKGDAIVFEGKEAGLVLEKVL